MASVPALPVPGDIIAEKYRIEQTIGDGGMSVVFGATHCVTGKRFAIKWLLPDDDAATSAHAAQRFIREAQVAGVFQHPNVVEVYDVGEIAGSYYMVMEWLHGESLAERLARGSRLSLAEACALLIPCMRGIEEAHAHGIVHRDLKPANIFVCSPTRHSPEKTKVLDFGIAKLTTPSLDRESFVTQTGVLIGTPYYLSPEQLRNEPVDHRTDIYAFGVVLYQVLSGQLPFTSNTFGGLVLQIATGTPIPLCELAEHLPRGVEPVVMRAMARDPAARFAQLHELIDALEPFSRQPFARTRPSEVSIPALPMETPHTIERRVSAGPAALRSRSSMLWALALVSLFSAAGLVLFFEANRSLSTTPTPIPIPPRALPVASAPSIDASTETERAALTEAPVPSRAPEPLPASDLVAPAKSDASPPLVPRPKSHPRTKLDPAPAPPQTIEHNPLDMHIQ